MRALDRTALTPASALALGRAYATQATAARAPRERIDPLRAVLMLLVLMSVSRLHQHFGFIAVMRPAVLLAGAALGYAILNPRLVSRLPWPRTWPSRVVAALGILACVGAPFGISLGHAARFILEDYVKTLVFTFLLMATIRKPRDLGLYVWGYVIASGVLVWMSLFVFGLSQAGPDGIYRLSALYTYDANDVGVVLLAGLGLALITFEVSAIRGKIASAVIIAGIGAALARTGSRGAFMGLIAFCAAIVLLLDRRGFGKRLFLVGSLALGLQLYSPAGYWDQMLTVFQPKQDYNWESATGRRMVAKRGMQYMMQYPLFGLGIDNFAFAEGTISQRAKDWRPGQAGIKWTAPHNSFVQAGAEMGIPGLVLWSSLVIGGIVSMVRIRKRLPREWAQGDPDQRLLYATARYLPVSLAAFGASAFFVSFAYMDPIYIIAALVAGMHVLVGRQARNGAPGRGRVSRQRRGAVT